MSQKKEGGTMVGKKEKALELLTLGEYNTFDEVAKALKISRKTLQRWRGEEEFSKELNRRINIKIGSLAPRALRKMEKLLNSYDEDIVLKSSKDILDRAGYKATDKVNIDADATVKGTVSVAFEGDLDEWSE